jgi:glycosyltransferase involved in cell wall biosynthesis
MRKILIPFFANYLRIWDITSSNRVDHFIANSRHVARRIKKYYNRDAEIIYPPVDTVKFVNSGDSEADYYLLVSALVPYKRVDLAIHAFNDMERRLLIVGGGPDKSRLKKMANSNIEFTDWVSDKELIEYYSGCRALIVPGEEDFGIAPVEAQACGKPVIAFSRGGLSETVIGYSRDKPEKSSGIFFHSQVSSSLREAVLLCEKQKWDSTYIRKHAQEFSEEKFKLRLSEFIEKKIAEFI